VTNYRRIVAASLVACVGSIWTADVARSQSIELGRGAALLATPGVWEDLKLTEAQRSEFQSLWERVSTEQWALFQRIADAGADEAKNKLQDAARKSENEIRARLEKTLETGQFARFTQIWIQSMGYQAFFDRQVSKRLDLTPQQTSRIRELVSQLSRSQRREKGLRASPFEESPEARPDVRAKALAAALTVLTVEQKQSWQAIIGRPLELKPEIKPRQSDNTRTSLPPPPVPSRSLHE
jgi:hypothetical protein